MDRNKARVFLQRIRNMRSELDSFEAYIKKQLQQEQEDEEETKDE